MAQDAFVTVCQPGSHIEVAMIHSILKGRGIRYFIDNENYAQAHGFAVGFADTRMTLKVERDRAEEAAILLKKIIDRKSG